MKRSKVSILGGALLAGALAMSLASPAAADFTPQPKDIVGGGSDTTQFAMGHLADGASFGGVFNAGFNSTAAYRLVSFDAIVDLTGGVDTATPPNSLSNAVHNQITLKAGTARIQRPNGSGEGKALLFGAGNNTAANYARSSSALTADELAAGLQLVPFAVDGIKLAVRAAGTNAPATITPAQMVQIYSGAVTNWSQLGGSNGVIVPMIPQSGSGTRITFLARLQAANNGTAVTLANTVVEVQEHDPAPIAADANAIAPFSTGRAASQPTVALVNGAGSWSYTRALYNVVRNSDLTQTWFGSVFGSNGWICSTAALPLIQAAGFQQLAHPFDGGVCGVPTTAATTNFAVN